MYLHIDTFGLISTNDSLGQQKSRNIQLRSPIIAHYIIYKLATINSLRFLVYHRVSDTFLLSPFSS